MESNWSDDRLDGLSTTVDELGRRMERGFVESRTEMREFRAEMKEFRTEMRTEMKEFRTELSAEMKEFRAEVQAGFEQVDKRLVRVENRLYRTEVQLEGVNKLSDKTERKVEALIYAFGAVGTSVFLAAAGSVAF